MSSFALDPDAALEVRGVHKSYGSIEALRGVDFSLRRGELLALVGDNGAGKSTLMKVLSGAVIPDKGHIYVDGAEVHFRGPDDARKYGIEMIYQDLAVFNNLDVAANIFIGRERRVAGRFLNKRRMWQESAEILERMQINIASPRLLIDGMSGGQRQMIACARAVAFEPKILVMDEPTAALGVREANALLDLIERFKGAQSVMLITQRIPDVIAIADRVMVLKGGLSQGILNVRDVSIEDIETRIVRGARETAA